MTLPQRDDQRSTERFAGARDATLRDAGAVPRDAIVGDVSRTGFRITGAADLIVGDCISIGVPGLGQRAAQVVRMDEGGAGCVFDVVLTPSEIDHVLASQPLTPLAFPIERLPADEAPPASAGVMRGPLRLALLAAGVVVPWTVIVLLVR